jgi:glycosyltransferase involved in cell wall biosynthesis
MLHKPLVHSVATHYLGCSDKALDWLYDWTGVRSKARMINNGIETSKYVYNQTERINVRRELNIPMDAKVVGHVGSLIHVKNHEFLIRLFSEITKEIPESILLLVGEGELRNKLEALVAELRIQNNVIFTGSRSDVNRILQAMDLFVMPSFFEGLPVSLVEAQASGLPILASDTISKDVAITPNIKFISLNADIHVWTDAVKQQLFHFNRCDTSNMICNSGFDISGIANTLSTMYLSSYE